MTDFAVMGIGLKTDQAERNAKNFNKDLLQLNTTTQKMSKSNESMTASMIKADVIMSALSVSTRAVYNQFTQVIQTGKDFEQSMARVGAVSKANEEQFKMLEASALKMGETTSFSASQSASALESMARAGLKVEEQIGALPQVLNLSASSGVSLGESADIVTNIMSAMGKKVEDLNHVNNVLVETFTNTNTTLSGLANTFSYAGGIATTTGVSIEQLSAITGIFGNVGIDASRAGTTLRASMSRLIDPTKEASAVLEKLGVETGQNLIETLKQLENSGATSKDMVKIFGQEAGASLLALKQGGGIQAVEQLTAQLESVGNVADEVAKKQLDTLEGQLKLLDSAIEGVRIDIFRQSSEQLKDVVTILTAGISENKDQILAMSESVQIASKYILSFGDDMGGADVILGALNDTIKFATSGVMILASGFERAGESVSTSMSIIIDSTNTASEILNSLLKGDLRGVYNEINKGFSTVGGAISDEIKEIETDYLKLQKALDELWTDKAKTDSKEQIKSTQDLKIGVKEQTEAIKENSVKIKENVELKEEIKQVEDQIIDNKTTLAILEDAEIQKGTVLNSVIQEQSSQVKSLSDNYEKATESITKFASATARPGGTFSGSSLVGQTFSIVTGGSSSPVSNIPSSSYASPVQSSSISYNSELQKTQLLLNQYQSLLSNMQDYINKDVSLDLKLKDAESQLKSISEELASLGETELEKRLDLTEEYFERMKSIDDLKLQIAKQEEQDLKAQQSQAESIKDIIESISGDLNTIKEGDLSNALPVDKLKSLEAQFIATKTAIDNIDFSEITSADQELIKQFQNVSLSFLDQAKTVFKSSDNYTSLKNDVTAQFNDLAGKLTNSMASVDPKTFQTSLASLQTQFANNDQMTKVLNLTMDSLKDKTENVIVQNVDLNSSLVDLSGATQTTDQETSDLSQALAGTQSPLNTANQNFDTIAQNTAKTVDFIASKFANLQSAIDSGSDVVSGGDSVSTTPTKSFTEYLNFNGNYNAVYSDGSKELLISSMQNARNIQISGNSLTYQDYFGNPHEFISGVRAYEVGAWNINESRQKAVLHGGEMVIREDDSNAVRNFLKSTGRAEKYGQASGSSSNNYDSVRIIELLSEIAGILEDQQSPTVLLDGRKLNDGLEKYRKVSA